MLKAVTSLLDICILPAGQSESWNLKLDNYFIQIIIYDFSNHTLVVSCTLNTVCYLQN